MSEKELDSSINEYEEVNKSKGYIKQLEWDMAIGLQTVDNLKPSKHLEELLEENIRGKLSLEQVKKELRTYYIEKEENEHVNFKNFWVDGYWHFSEEQKAVFAYLADCIIAHNMWPASPDKIDIYNKCGLEELTPPLFQKISFAKNPILFILAIADTIEPIKLYLSTTQMSEVDIWKGIDIIFSKEYVKIKILDDRLSFESLLGKVNGLDNWIDVSIAINNEQREVKLTFV